MLMYCIECGSTNSVGLVVDDLGASGNLFGLCVLMTYEIM